MLIKAMPNLYREPQGKSLEKHLKFGKRRVLTAE